MNRYQPLEFRTAFAAAALALAMLTMALAVGVPARMATGTALLTGARASAVELMPIEIVGVRETDVAASPTRNPRG